MVPYIVNGDIDVVICDFQSICYNSPERNCYVSVKIIILKILDLDALMSLYYQHVGIKL